MSAGDSIPRPAGCKCHWEIGDSPCPVHGDNEEDEHEPGPHTCIYVGVDDHDECEICGRSLDQFAGLPEHMQPDWDGAE